MREEERASLLTLARGAAIERFDDELQRTLDNIVDLNAVSSVAREITLKVKIKPNPDRSRADVIITTGCKLAPSEPCTTMFFVGKDKTGGVAFEHNPDQQKLDLTPPATVRPING